MEGIAPNTSQIAEKINRKLWLCPSDTIKPFWTATPYYRKSYNPTRADSNKGISGVENSLTTQPNRSAKMSHVRHFSTSVGFTEFWYSHNCLMGNDVGIIPTNGGAFIAQNITSWFMEKIK